MKYITSVESNLKNHEKPTQLYPKTLIIAKNKAGKSAIVNAIEVALTGTASDIVGRPIVKEVNRLLSLAREDRIYAKATVGDTTEDHLEYVEWATKGKKGSFIAQPAGVYNPSTVFPLRTVREALGGSAESTRKFFIRFVAGSITDEDVLARIPTPLQQAFLDVTTGIPRTAPVDMLLAGLGRAKERLQALRSEVATRKDVVKESGQGLPPMPSDKEYTAAMDRIAELEVQLAEMDQTLGREQGNERLRQQYAEHRARKEEIEHVLDGLREQLANAEENWPAKPSPADEVRPMHLAVLKFAANNNLASCPTCKVALKDAGLVPLHNAPATFWAERVLTVEQAMEKRSGIACAYSDHSYLVDQLKRDIDLQLQQLTDMNRRLELLGVMPEALDMSSFEMEYGDLKSELDLIRQQLRGMDAAKASWAPVLKARDTAVEKEGEIDRWIRLIDALKTAVGDLLDKGRDAFITRVQQYLPEGDTFGLVLHDEDREVCQYGLLRDGKLHEALSGVEWAYVTAAIAAAAIPDDEKDKLHVLVFEDRSWDADTLLAVCTATTKLEAQVIIATAPPDGWIGKKFPHEWHIIDPTARVRDEVDEFQKMAEGGKDEIEAQRAENEKVEQVDDGEAPKFIRAYIEKHPDATAADLVREFKISANRAAAFLPMKPANVTKARGRKKAAPKAEQPKRQLPPELE